MNNDVGVFRVAVSAIILNDNNEILITQRSYDREHHAGEWETTTGRLAQGEDFITALKREINEELNITVEPIAIIGTFHFYRGIEKIEHVGVNYLCKYKSGKIQVDGVEEIAYQWLNLESALKIIKDESILSSIRMAINYLKN